MNHLLPEDSLPAQLLHMAAKSSRSLLLKALIAFAWIDKRSSSPPVMIASAETPRRQLQPRKDFSSQKYSHQQVLTGEIEFRKVATDHSVVLQPSERAAEEGAMLSDVHIEHVPDRDDEWIEFVFDRVVPDRLFERRLEQARGKNALKKQRDALRR